MSACRRHGVGRLRRDRCGGAGSRPLVPRPPAPPLRWPPLWAGGHPLGLSTWPTAGSREEVTRPPTRRRSTHRACRRVDTRVRWRRLRRRNRREARRCRTRCRRAKLRGRHGGGSDCHARGGRGNVGRILGGRLDARRRRLFNGRRGVARRQELGPVCHGGTGRGVGAPARHLRGVRWHYATDTRDNPMRHPQRVPRLVNVASCAILSQVPRTWHHHPTFPTATHFRCGRCTSRASRCGRPSVGSGRAT